MIESHGVTIIRTNCDAPDFNMNKLINQIYQHISQSNKEKEVEIKKIKEQNKRTRKQNKRTKEQVFKRIIKLYVWHFYACKTHQIFF